MKSRGYVCALLDRGTLDHAEQGREPPDESVTVVVGGVVSPVAPPCCCCCCCCEGSRVERGNRELPLLLGGLGGES